MTLLPYLARGLDRYPLPSPSLHPVTAVAPFFFRSAQPCADCKFISRIIFTRRRPGADLANCQGFPLTSPPSPVLPSFSSSPRVTLSCLFGAASLILSRPSARPRFSHQSEVPLFFFSRPLPPLSLFLPPPLPLLSFADFITPLVSVRSLSHVQYFIRRRYWDTPWRYRRSWRITAVGETPRSISPTSRQGRLLPCDSYKKEKRHCALLALDTLRI